MKRHWFPALLLGIVLAVVGIILRAVVSDVPPMHFTGHHLLLGLAVVAAVLCSDALLHGLFLLSFGKPYSQRHQELVARFRGQSLPAIVVGSLLAGCGEELVFRGLTTSPLFLGVFAVAFGLLHHISLRLWPFTLWSIYQGVLFVIAMVLFEDLTVTMVAHFMHDFCGFLLFRYLNAVTVPPS